MHPGGLSGSAPDTRERAYELHERGLDRRRKTFVELIEGAFTHDLAIELTTLAFRTFALGRKARELVPSINSFECGIGGGMIPGIAPRHRRDHLIRSHRLAPQPLCPYRRTCQSNCRSG
jgi:hypothetical protein